MADGAVHHILLRHGDASHTLELAHDHRERDRHAHSDTNTHTAGRDGGISEEGPWKREISFI